MSYRREVWYYSMSMWKGMWSSSRSGGVARHDQCGVTERVWALCWIGKLRQEGQVQQISLERTTTRCRTIDQEVKHDTTPASFRVRRYVAQPRGLAQQSSLSRPLGVGESARQHVRRTCAFEGDSEPAPTTTSTHHTRLNNIRLHSYGTHHDLPRTQQHCKPTETARRDPGASASPRRPQPPPRPPGHLYPNHTYTPAYSQCPPPSKTAPPNSTPSSTPPRNPSPANANPASSPPNPSSPNKMAPQLPPRESSAQTSPATPPPSAEESAPQWGSCRD